MTTIALVSCTTKKKQEDTLLFKSLQNLSKNDMYATFDYTYFFTDNKQGLCARYNEFLEKHADDYDIVVFVHDDVFIDDANIRNKLIEAHTQYDIVGVAGGVNPTIRRPALWHLMCGGFGPNLRGFVGHYTEDGKIMMTNFGPTPDRVAIADGLFLSIKTSQIRNVGWKFNERYNFHHYDISSCLDANKAKLKIGVYPILIYHMSPGLRSLSDPTFLENQEKFIKEYGCD